MKKIALSISMILALTLGGCSSSSSSDDTNTTGTNETKLECISSIAGAAVPTADQLTQFAGIYSGEIGTLDQTTMEWAPTGNATVEFSQDGQFTLDTIAYASKSTCYIPATATFGAMILIEFNNDSHVDLFEDFKFSGISPKDGESIISNMN